MGAAAPRVSFLVAGVQKGGTTALFDYLREHPALHLAPAKEVHFFDDEDGVDWSAPDYGAYHAAFAPEPAGESRLWGEATPIYVYWPNALERIRAYNPAMKLVLVLRDPVERAFSHWKMETARGAETEPFAWCIREGRERVRAAPNGAHRVFSYVERGFYAAQLERLFAFFPREQVLLLRSEQLGREPQRILGNACDFLRISPFATISQRRSHVGPVGAIDALLTQADREYLRSVYEADLRRLREIARIDWGE